MFIQCLPQVPVFCITHPCPRSLARHNRVNYDIQYFSYIVRTKLAGANIWVGILGCEVSLPTVACVVPRSSCAIDDLCAHSSSDASGLSEASAESAQHESQTAWWRTRAMTSWHIVWFGSGKSRPIRRVRVCPARASGHSPHRCLGLSP
jgi:hypothetical protein